MKINFCTLFNSNYLTRGMVMYNSLLKHCQEFQLYIFAFDDDCYRFLKEQNHKNITVISLKEFENENLLKIKSDRTAAEYCWTCTPSIIHYSIQTFNLAECTYLDADLCFFSDPAALIEEMGNESVLITDHRYTKQYDQSATSGKYCVQFLTFRNDEDGMTVLNSWKDACIEWCYDRFEDGKFGDQKYLDEWKVKFKGVHELKNLGGGVAPWNVQQYSFVNEMDKIIGTERSTGNKFELVFFHYHGMKFYSDQIVYLTYAEYDLSKDALNCLYKPYIQNMEMEFKKIFQIDPSLNANGASGNSPWKSLNLKIKIYYYLKDLRNSISNIFGKNMKYRIEHHHYHEIQEFLK